MSNPLLPSSTITINFTDYVLRFDFESVAEAEEIVNRPLVTGLTVDDVYHPKVSLVRAMFFAAAHRDQPKLTYDAAKALITRDNLNDVWMKVIEAWTAQNPTPDEQDSPTADPTPAQS
jgi:hypothetical protein